MDIEAFSQLGIGLSTLLILWFVVRYFIDTLTKKDEYIARIVSDFNTTINNHIDHSTKAQDKNSRALEQLTKALNKLLKSK